MNYIPNQCISKKALVIEKNLTSEINTAASRLYKKLKTLNTATLSISDYNRNYLIKDHLGNLTRTLQKYSYILFSSVQATGLPLSDITFLDYGGGIGILALLAREAGIKTVLYNDIYAVSCDDARTLGRTLAIEADHYITGDIDDVIIYTKNNTLACNIIASYDVIEHVYNIDTFLKKITELSTAKRFTVFMSSGANIYNYRIRKTLQKHHEEHEYADRIDALGDHKQRDCLESFFSVRKKMIQEFAPSLSEDELVILARATRGKIKNDILRVVSEYKEKTILPAVPLTTDTCDPYTGNWSEHLMDPYQLKTVLEKEGFYTKVLCGLYGRQHHTFKNYITTSLNNVISYIPTKIGLRIAPFYTIFGVRR
jgi:2-polyprenyl-3-methyl-5-hydroxy-6-metoxy-1,4-benzoquinol methylase